MVEFSLAGIEELPKPCQDIWRDQHCRYLRQLRPGKDSADAFHARSEAPCKVGVKKWVEGPRRQIPNRQWDEKSY